MKWVKIDGNSPKTSEKCYGNNSSQQPAAGDMSGAEAYDSGDHTEDLPNET